MYGKNFKRDNFIPVFPLLIKIYNLLLTTLLVTNVNQISCLKQLEKLFEVDEGDVNILNWQFLNLEKSTAIANGHLLYSDLNTIYDYNLNSGNLQTYYIENLFKPEILHSNCNYNIDVKFAQNYSFYDPEANKNENGVNFLLILDFTNCSETTETFTYIITFSATEKREITLKSFDQTRVENVKYLESLFRGEKNEDKNPNVFMYGISTESSKSTGHIISVNYDQNQPIKFLSKAEFDLNFEEKTVQGLAQNAVLLDANWVEVSQNGRKFEFAIGIVSQDNWSKVTQPLEYVNILITEQNDNRITKSVTVTVKCSFQSVKSRNNIGKFLVQSKVSIASITNRRIIFVREFINDFRYVEFFQISIETLMSQGSDCDQKCTIDSSLLSVPYEFYYANIEAVTSYIVENEKEFMLAAVRNSTDSSLTITRFAIFDRVSDDAAPKIELHFLDTIATFKDSSDSMTFYSFETSDDYVVLARQMKDKEKVEFYQVAQIDPDCARATNCFQCYSSVFGLGKCLWADGVCKKASEPLSTKSCSPKIDQIAPSMIHADQITTVQLIGNSISNEVVIKCQVYEHYETEFEDYYEQILTFKARHRLNSYPSYEAEFAIDTQTLKIDSEKDLLCTAISSSQYLKDYDINLEFGEVLFPELIKIRSPEILDVSPKTIPYSVGSLLTITGKNLWNGIIENTYPELVLDQGNRRYLITSRFFSRTPNSVTYLVTKPVNTKLEQGVQAEVEIEYEDNSIRRWQKGSVNIQDPRDIQIIQDETIIEGGIDIVFTDDAIEAISKPVMITTIVYNPEPGTDAAASMIKLEPGNCSFFAADDRVPEPTIHCQVPPVPDYIINDEDFSLTTASVTLKSSDSLKQLYCGSELEMCGFHDDLLSDGNNVVKYTQPPTIYKIDQPNSLKLNSAKDRLLNISYSNIDLDWLKHSLVKVLIGESGECTITNYTNTTLTCEAPKNIPKQETIYFYIGSNLPVDVGMFYYEKEISMFLLSLTIGCSIAFLVIFLFISLVVWLHRRKSQVNQIGFNDPKLGANSFSMHSLNENDPTSIIPEEELEQLNEFTDSAGIKMYAAQRISPVLIFGISEKPIGQGQFGEVFRAVLKYPQELNHEQNQGNFFLFTPMFGNI